MAVKETSGVGFFLFYPTTEKTLEPASANGPTGVKWSATLTGSPDLELIIFNLQATLRDVTASFIQIVVPFSQLDEVLARTDEDIILYKTLLPNGSPVELYRVNFNDLRIDQGARNRKLTLSGRSQTAFPAPSIVTLVGVVLDDLQASGARTLSVSPFNDVIPGDTVSYDSILTNIEIVQITADAGGTAVTLTES